MTAIHSQTDDIVSILLHCIYAFGIQDVVKELKNIFMLLNTVELLPLCHQLGTTCHCLFSPFQPRTSSKWWAIVLIRHYPLVDDFQLLAFLLSNSQLELLSAECKAFLVANFLACLTMQTSWNIFANDGAGDPRHPISTGWVIPSLPSSLPTLVDEVFILGLLALVRLVTSFFPRHSQLHNDNLLCLG